jgi:hypothetical protein
LGYRCCAGEGEHVSLGKNLKARGNVEKWLGDVEASMIGEGTRFHAPLFLRLHGLEYSWSQSAACHCQSHAFLQLFQLKEIAETVLFAASDSPVTSHVPRCLP